MSIQITPEIKEALKKQKEQCPFCKIIKGEIPSNKIYEDDKVVAILDINPLTQGHTLLMPKEHYPILPYLSWEEFNHMCKITKELIFCLKKALLKTGCNVLVQNGAVAGQNSPHFMIHIIPREKGDNISLFNMSGKEPDEQTSAKTKEIQSTLSHNLQIMVENHFKRNPVNWHTPKEQTGQLKQSYTKDQIIQIIESNPQIKKIIQENPEGFIMQLESNTQLKQLFADVDVHEIISVFNKDYKKNYKKEHDSTDSKAEIDAEIVDEKDSENKPLESEKHDDEKHDDEKHDNEKKAFLDNVSSLFK